MMKKMLSKTKLVAIAFSFMLLGVLCFVNGKDKVQAADSTSAYVTEAFTDADTIKNYFDTAEAYPTKDGYLFAGWFRDTDCTLENAVKVYDSTIETYYAKFVPEEVLSIKAQISTVAGSTTVDEVVKETRNIRFVSSVDDLTYGKVGFKLEFDGTTMYNNSKTVFDRIASNTTGDEYSFSPKVVDTDSEHFITAIWKNVTEDEFGTGFYVRAYWKTLDGTVVYGPSRYVTVNDGLTTNTVIIPVKDEQGTLAQAENIAVKYNDGTRTLDTEATKVELIARDEYGADEDDTYAHLRVTLAGTKTDLDSVTTFEITDTELSAKYRNLYTTYTEDSEASTDTADTSWFYQNLDESEYIIATAADLYGFAKVVNNGNLFVGGKVYLVSDIVVNKGTAGTSSWSTTYTDENGTEQTGTAYYWNDIGSTSSQFTGTFDGQMHTISGINYDVSQNTTSSGTNFHGFFGETAAKSEIKNLKLLNSVFNFKGKNNCGSIVGRANGSTLQNVYSEANVSSSSQHLGGIVGANNSSGGVTMANCWFNGIVTATYSSDNIYTGGLLANARSGATITNCKNTGKISVSKTDISNAYIGGLVARVNGTTTLSNCLTAGTVTLGASSDATSIVTTDCGVVVGGIDNSQTLICTNVFAMNDSISQSNGTDTITASAAVDGQESYTGVTMLSESGLTGVAAYANTKNLNYYTDNQENGAWVIGTDLNPVPKTLADEWIDIAWFCDKVTLDSENYEVTSEQNYQFTISDADEFYALPVIAANYNFKTDTISLANDIELNSGKATDWNSGYTAGVRKWTPIGSSSIPFKGTFDGKENTISGICMIETSGNFKGMFGGTEGATIQNLKLVNSYIYSDYGMVGSIVGRAQGGDFENVYSEAIVSAGGENVGGLVGHVGGAYSITMDKCWFAGAVRCNSEKNPSLGGLVGTAGGVTMTNCLNSGTITSKYNLEDNPYVGGLIGKVAKTATIQYCLNRGKVNYSTDTETIGFGSLVGNLQETTTTCNITNSYALAGTCTKTDDEGNTVTVLANGGNAATGLTTDENTKVVSSSYEMTALINSDNWVTVPDSYPVLKCFESLASSGAAE